MEKTLSCPYCRAQLRVLAYRSYRCSLCRGVFSYTPRGLAVPQGVRTGLGQARGRGIGSRASLPPPGKIRSYRGLRVEQRRSREGFSVTLELAGLDLEAAEVAFEVVGGDILVITSGKAGVVPELQVYQEILIPEEFDPRTLRGTCQGRRVAIQFSPRPEGVP